MLASKVADLHISDEERDNYQTEALDRDSTVAKIRITVLDVNDNAPVFEKSVYNVGISSKANINELVTVVNATDLDMGENGALEMLIISSNLYKFGSNRSTGSIVPSPFGEFPVPSHKRESSIQQNFINSQQPFQRRAESQLQDSWPNITRTVSFLK